MARLDPAIIDTLQELIKAGTSIRDAATRLDISESSALKYTTDLRKRLRAAKSRLDATDAACFGMDTNMWYPEDHDDRSTVVEAAAKAICAHCPIQTQCLDTAMAEEGGMGAAGRYGIRGGLNGEQRRNRYKTLTLAALKARKKAEAAA
ncbi:WhiB family transcriptional regulator [Streptomyces sp. T1317-0309]|nr:WhiB family transcriptional regulator [Streptomyces sp. T1317-0309]